jgi:phosphotransacetylase
MKYRMGRPADAIELQLPTFSIESLRDSIEKSSRDDAFVDFLIQKAINRQSSVIVASVHGDPRTRTSVQNANEMKIGRVRLIESDTLSNQEKMALVPILTKAVREDLGRKAEKAGKKLADFLKSPEANDADARQKLEENVRVANDNYARAEEIARDEYILGPVGPLWQASVLAHMGEADALVGGADATTKDFLNAYRVSNPHGSPKQLLFASYIITGVTPEKMKPQYYTHVNGVSRPGSVLLLGDPAFNPELTAEQIAFVAYESARKYGQLVPSVFAIPIIAMLSYSTGNSGDGGHVKLMAEATRIYYEKYPDGPLNAGVTQLDAALESIAYIVKLQSLLEKQYSPEGIARYRYMERIGATVLIGSSLHQMNCLAKSYGMSWPGVISMGPNIHTGERLKVADQSRSAHPIDQFMTIVEVAADSSDTPLILKG